MQCRAFVELLFPDGHWLEIPRHEDHRRPAAQRRGKQWAFSRRDFGHWDANLPQANIQGSSCTRQLLFALLQQRRSRARAGLSPDLAYIFG
jgi:hypothetical protein